MISATVGPASRPTRERRFDRQSFVTAALAVAEAEGPQALTMRRLATYLDADPTAAYRHFANKDELLRAIGDRLIGTALDGYVSGTEWLANLRELAIRTYRALLVMPDLTRLVAVAPPQGEHENRLTELLLEQLAAGGFSGREQALAYHGIIEYTVGVATIDAPIAGLADAGAEIYERVRSRYRATAPHTHPQINAVVDEMYRSDIDQFIFGLDMMLSGLHARSKQIR